MPTNQTPYQILWLEDEREDDSTFEDEASDFNLVLTHAETVEDALRILERCNIFDGAILDAKSIERPGDAAHLGTIGNAITGIKLINNDLPLVIFSGQKGDSSEWKTASMNFHRTIESYRKGIPAEKEKMFQDLKLLIKQRPVSTIRNKYHDIYEFCNRWLGKKSWPALQHCLLHIEHNQPLGGLEPYNGLRQIFEELCQAYGKMGLIPSKFYTEKVKMTDWVHFLAGNHKGYRLEPDFPSLPGLFNHGLLQFFSQLLNDGSHADPKQENKQKALITQLDTATNENHHLIHVLTYLTIDLLRITKGIFKNEDYHDSTENKTLWSQWKGELIENRKGQWEIQLLNVNDSAQIHPKNEDLKRVLEMAKKRNICPIFVHPELILNKFPTPRYFAEKINLVPRDGNEK